MRIVGIIARFFLGLEFTVFGLNGFLHFLKMKGPPPSHLATMYFTALAQSHIMVFVFAVQLFTGILLLSTFFTPLALTLLGPVIVNILLFHVTMEPSGIAPGAAGAILWFIVFFTERAAFQGIFRMRD